MLAYKFFYKNCLDETIKNKESNINKSKKEVSNAQKAFLIIKRTKQGYEAYELANEGFNEVNNKIKIKRELEKEKNFLLTEIKSIGREIQVEKKTIRRTKKELEQK